MLKSGTDYDTNYIILILLTDHLNFSCTKCRLFSVCRLQEEYPQWFEKPVLEMVHHNTVSLDKLVEMAWVEILTKYAEYCCVLDHQVLKRSHLRTTLCCGT